MSTAPMVGYDLHLRHTDKEGRSHVQQHRVWDGARFMTAQQAAAANVNADQPADAPRKARVEQITEDQYRKEKAA